MPGFMLAPEEKKRKSALVQVEGARKKRKVLMDHEEANQTEAHIIKLENQIAESRKYYNNIATLLSIARRTANSNHGSRLLAVISLCRVFCRLHAGGSLVAAKGLPQNEATIVQWLKERYKEYTELLLGNVKDGAQAEQSTALKLVMQLIREESTNVKRGHEYIWRTGLLAALLKRLLEGESTAAVRDEYVEDFVEKYADLRFYTFQIIGDIASDMHSPAVQQVVIGNSLHILSTIGGIPQSKDDLDKFYGDTPSKSNHQLYSVSAHQKAAQTAWLALLRQRLPKDIRKSILGMMTHRIAPWFLKLELLMDFLTDSYNVGGATSLLALSGLFYLIKEKNLDYPSFYPKLYSLLDENLLHSKHRSRFFRLLETFISSTHLPAVLVASFIKRLARLALHAPPAGIVAVVPWIYNMLMNHPTCTFMIHRETLDPAVREGIKENGIEDPFDMNELDPMQTHAIDSSLWELETLQSHYHPNVATLAKVISEQFTKRSYNLEDFLDHSYESMISAELGKELKKAPVVEWQIPKKVFVHSDTEPGQLESLMTSLLESS